MSKKKRAVFIVVWVALMVIVLVAALLVGGSGESESIKVVMRDAVLHGTNKVSLFGIKDVNPAYISSLIVCGALLVFAAVIRIFVIPKFKMVPGKFQMLLEQLVTELVYYNISLSFVLPVFVGIMFTLLHALIQAYVLTMLTAMFYGEVSEPPVKAVKKRLSKSTNK